MQRRGVVPLLLGPLAAACSLLLDGEPTPLRCSQEGRVGPPACDDGFLCQGGTCVIQPPVSVGGAPVDLTPEGEAGWRGKAGDSGGRS